MRIGERSSRNITSVTQPTILIVDDDASIRDAIAEFLASRGYAVRSADCAQACRRELQSARVDLIVLDVMMPGEDGLSLCRDLAPKGTPILMLSALDALTDRIVGWKWVRGITSPNHSNRANCWHGYARCSADPGRHGWRYRMAMRLRSQAGGSMPNSDTCAIRRASLYC